MIRNKGLRNRVLADEVNFSDFDDWCGYVDGVAERVAHLAMATAKRYHTHGGPNRYGYEKSKELSIDLEDGLLEIELLLENIYNKI